MGYWHVPCYRWLRRCEVYWLSVPFVVLSKVWPTRGYFTTCSYRHFRSVLDLTEVQPEKLRVRGNPRKGIISVRILRPRSEIRKYETKQNHVRKLRNDSSKWYDWNLKGIRILAFSLRNLRKYEAYLALCNGLRCMGKSLMDGCTAPRTMAMDTSRWGSGEDVIMRMGTQQQRVNLCVFPPIPHSETPGPSCSKHR